MDQDLDSGGGIYVDPDEEDPQHCKKGKNS